MASLRPETVPEALWQRFAAVGQPTDLSAERFLWTPGDTLSSSYLVTVGLMRLYHLTRSGQLVTLLAVGRGGFLGYHPESGEQFHVTGAEALCDVSLLRLPSPNIAEWFNHQGATGRAFATWLHQDLIAQLQDTQLRFGLEHDSAAVRIAHTLLALDQQSLLGRVSRTHIAELANLSAETVARTLSQFVRGGRLTSSRLTSLSEAERLALAQLLEPYELSSTPYS